MEQNYFVNPLELAIAAATAAGSGAIAGVCLFLGRFLSALVFLAIALLFFKIALDAGAKISIGKDGVSRRLLGKTTHSFKWEEIAETGAAGSKILNKGNPNKTGTDSTMYLPGLTSQPARPSGSMPAATVRQPLQLHPSVQKYLKR